MAKSTILKVKNITGATIAAGKAVYISGFDTTDSVATVALASNDAVDKMPAVGLVAEEIPNNEVGTVRVSGAFSPIDTTAGYVNAPVFIGRNGGLVFSDPTAGRPPKVVDEDEDEDDNVTSSSTAFKLGKVSAPRTATNRPVKVTSARSRSISRNLDSTAQQIGVVMSVGSSGSIQLFPLEIKNRIKHDDIIDVKTDQHHRKKHAAAHYKNGSDPIKHGSLADLNKDAHTQYILVNGSRAFTGTVSGITPTADTHLVTKAYVDAIVTGGAATQFVSQTTFQENKNAQYQINQSIIQALDGYLTIASSGVSELTFSENKNSQYQVNQSILQSLDGYITIADLSGYTTDAEFSGLDQTVTEHYNQLTQIIQDVCSATDGYAQDSTVTEHYNQLTQIIQDVRSATDGYATDVEFAELTLTVEENKSAQFEVNQVIIQALDGYDLTIQENKIAQFEINQVIIQALDGYDVTIQENKSAQQQINQTVLQAIDGYVVAPQVGFGADGQIAFFVGDNLHIEGESQLFWDRTNNYLGVGTSVPVRKLEVTESADSNTVNLANSHVSFSQTVLKLGTVRANDNAFGFISAATSTDADAVGGTVIFNVKGDAQTVIGPSSSLMTSRLQVNTDSTYTGTSQVFGGLYAGSDVVSAQAVLRKTRGTIASPTIVSSGDKIGTLAFQAYDGASIQNAAYIEAIVDGTPSAGDMPGRLSLWTTPDGSATSQERLRVWNGGHVSVIAADSFYSSRSAALEVLTQTSFGPQGLSLFHAETGSNGPSLNLRHTRGTHGSPTIVAVDDQIGGLFFQGYTGTGFQNGAAILSYIDAAPGATDMPGRLSFLTTPDGSTTVTERMRISNNGNVRIGDSGAGASLLEANRSTNSGEYIRIVNTNVGVNATAATIVSSNAAGLQLMALGGSYTFTQLGSTTAGRAVISTDSGSSAGLHIGTEHASAPLVFATAGVSRATIDASGNAFFYKNVSIGGDIINKHLSETFLTIRVALDGYAFTTNEIKSAQDQINQSVIQALDGYDLTIQENKSAQYQVNQTIIQALDGYGLTTNEIKSAQDQINQSVIQALDGYNADIISLNNTVTEHYNQLSQNINDVISVIDGYATNLTVVENFNAQQQINQSILQSLDGYAQNSTVEEHYSQLSQNINDIISIIDGYATDIELSGLTLTVEENKSAQYQVNQSIIQALDGYAFTTNEIKSAQEQVNQSIIQAIDGYAVTINEIKSAQDQINQSITQALDGYVVELTFQENKNFQELVNQRTVQALDGYAITINEIKSAQDQINQSIIQALDGYVVELTFQENKNAQQQINQSILQSLDGYITAAASGVSEQTFQENKNAQEQVNQSIIQALDGYDLAIQENKSAQYQVNQSIIQALDGYGAGTGNGNVSGSGIDGYVAYWNGTESITGSGDFYYNYEDGYLGLGTDAPNARLTVNGVISIMPVQAAPLEEDNFGKLYMDNSGDLFYLRSDGEKINLTLRIIDGGPFVI